MRANGWVGDAIDVVRMRDGGLTSIDNTRLLAAKRWSTPAVWNLDVSRHTRTSVLWFVFGGLWLAIGHAISGALLCVTIIGIPLGLANFKLIPISLLPLGREIVSSSDLVRPWPAQ